MKLEEVKISRPNRYKGYTIKHNVAVYATSDEIKDVANDGTKLTQFVLNAVKSEYDLSEYTYGLGKTYRSCFGVRFHVYLLVKNEDIK